MLEVGDRLSRECKKWLAVFRVTFLRAGASRTPRGLADAVAQALAEEGHEKLFEGEGGVLSPAWVGQFTPRRRPAHAGPVGLLRRRLARGFEALAGFGTGTGEPRPATKISPFMSIARFSVLAAPERARRIFLCWADSRIRRRHGDRVTKGDFECRGARRHHLTMRGRGARRRSSGKPPASRPLHPLVTLRKCSTLYSFPTNSPSNTPRAPAGGTYSVNPP